MLEELIRADKELFLTIHHFRNGFLDVIMPVFTNRWIWVPLYVFFAWWLYRKFKGQLIVIIPVVALMILISDQGANLFKNNVKRPRPCHDIELLKTNVIITPNGCGGPYGYFSGHAANSWALAVLMFCMVTKADKEKRKWWLLLFAWAILVAWSRIYLGVHYPGDVLSGGIFGAIVGMSVFALLNKYYFNRKNA